jgi:hypothetical protein
VWLARKAGGATAWRPSPAAYAAHALAGGPEAASRRQGLGLEHHDYAADASDKKSGGGAHRGGQTSMGQSGGVLAGGRVDDGSD